MTRHLSQATLRRFGTLAAKGRGVTLPAYHPSVRAGRSIFPSRVFDPDEVQRVLKTGHQSRKIGKVVTKGKRRGWPIFTLTLEERATCPSSCAAWAFCYGNNMQAAERITHGAELMAALERELADLQVRHPAGFMVRLHVLGDFWSTDYVAFWSAMLERFPAVHVFGFTAHGPQSEIGRALALMTADHGWARCAIGFSGLDHFEDRASHVISPGEKPAHAIVCPAQTGGTDCCATCALCWHSERSIAFWRH